MKILAPSAVFASICLLAASACSPAPPQAAVKDTVEEWPTVTFIVVRHAEKASDGTDPPLSEAGLQRAQRLADWLDDIPLVAIHSSDYLRTRQTVQPVAERKGLDIALYDAGQPAAGFVATLRERHREGHVLIAGHSNTVPGILSALCACEVEDMDESNYERMGVVELAADGSSRLRLLDGVLAVD